MTKFLKLFSLIALGVIAVGVCTPLCTASPKKVVVIRFVYENGNDIDDGVRIIEAREGVKRLLRETQPSQSGSIARTEVIDIHQTGILGEGILIAGIDQVKEGDIPAYTTEELIQFQRTKYNEEQIPLKWLFGSKNWEKSEVWLFNKKENKWYSVPFDQYNSFKPKTKGGWRMMIWLLLLLLAVGLYTMIRRRKRG